MTLLAALFGATSPTPAAASTLSYVRAPDGTPLCVYETGNPQGPAVVFLHGFSQTHAVFKRQYESELAHEYRLIGVDLRGHGCSGKPWEDAAYATPEVWAHDLEAVFLAKSIRTGVVVAWSFGAYIVADYVRTFGRGPIAGAILVGSTAALLPPDIDPAAKRRRAPPPPSPPPARLELESAALGATAFVPLMSASPLPEDLAEIMRIGNLQLPAYASLAMTRRELRNDDLTRRFDMPIRFFVGADDRANTPALMDKAASALPSAAVVKFSHSGHSPFAEEPEAFNLELRHFLRDTLGNAGH